MIFILLFYSILTSCFDEEYVIETDYLISKIYSADKSHISTYTYNVKNQLIRREFHRTIPNAAYSYDTYLYYPDGLIKRIISADVTYGNTYFYDYFYDKGRVEELRSYDNGRLYSTENFICSNKGEISYYIKDKKIRSKFEYLNKNVIKETVYYVDDWSGKHLSHTAEYKYDNKKRPSDGLNYLPRRYPLPVIMQIGGFIPSLSKNNFIRSNNHPVSYLYKYNENDLPIEIKAIYQEFRDSTLYISDTTTYIIEYQERY